MVISGVSTLASSLMAQDAMTATQKKLNEATNEQATGRYSDVGLTLGGNVTRNLNWRVSLSDTTNFLDTNAQALSKADALQSSLEAAKTTASSFINTLTSSRNAQNGATLAAQGASNSIDAVTSAVNVSYAGQFLMGGQNPSVAPLNNYQGGAAQTAFNSAFQSYFGFAATDPAAKNITAAQMTSFLQGPYESLFQSPSWESNFSNATSSNIQTQIDSKQQVDLSANANEQPIKDLMKGMVAVQDAGAGQLNAAAFQVVVDYSIGKVSNAVDGLGQTESRVGQAQQTVKDTNTKLTSMKTIMETEISKTEGVDPAEAATRVNNLSTQLEANYTVTGKLAKLSLLNYI